MPPMQLHLLQRRLQTTQQQPSRSWPGPSRWVPVQLPHWQQHGQPPTHRCLRGGLCPKAKKVAPVLLPTSHLIHLSQANFRPGCQCLELGGEGIYGPLPERNGAQRHIWHMRSEAGSPSPRTWELQSRPPQAFPGPHAKASSPGGPAGVALPQRSHRRQNAGGLLAVYPRFAPHLPERIQSGCTMQLRTSRREAFLSREMQERQQVVGRRSAEARGSSEFELPGQHQEQCCLGSLPLVVAGTKRRQLLHLASWRCRHKTWHIAAQCRAHTSQGYTGSIVWPEQKQWLQQHP
mmetsp:Transcript_126147/g.251967  ORF Transcript_126147/g.251967 Transcript_126147/m.251967 type:complete len:291 (+) Transcript_126147:127-999(+)